MCIGLKFYCASQSWYQTPSKSRAFKQALQGSNCLLCTFMYGIQCWYFFCSPFIQIFLLWWHFCYDGRPPMQVGFASVLEKTIRLWAGSSQMEGRCEVGQSKSMAMGWTGIWFCCIFLLRTEKIFSLAGCHHHSPPPFPLPLHTAPQTKDKLEQGTNKDLGHQGPRAERRGTWIQPNDTQVKRQRTGSDSWWLTEEGEDEEVKIMITISF